jgi:hypothetical protein
MAIRSRRYVVQEASEVAAAERLIQMRVENMGVPRHIGLFRGSKGLSRGTYKQQKLKVFSEGMTCLLWAEFLFSNEIILYRFETSPVTIQWARKMHSLRKFFYSCRG